MKYRRHLLTLAFLLGLLLLLSTIITEPQAHQKPQWSIEDISGLLSKETLSPTDYQHLFNQTGLGPAAVDELRTTPAGREQILAISQYFFAPVTYRCDKNSPISREESLVDADDQLISGTILAPLHNSDILITSASHTFGWRNGHVALVVDAQKGQTLESVVLGTNSSLQNIQKWTNYPNFIVLRLKDISPEIADAIAEKAVAALYDIPYRLSVGLLSPKEQLPEAVTGTHCAHLIWQAYQFFGYDLDYNQGAVVTPMDIAKSPLLEVVQIYGIDPVNVDFDRVQ